MACLEGDTKPYRIEANGIEMPVTFLAYWLSQVFRFRLTRRLRRQGKMSSRFFNAAGAAALLMLSTQTASAQITFPWERSQQQQQGYPQGQPQSDDADMEMRIQ